MTSSTVANWIAAIGLLFGSGGIVTFFRGLRRFRLARGQEETARMHAQAAKATAEASLSKIAVDAIGTATEMFRTQAEGAFQRADQALAAVAVCEAKHEDCEREVSALKTETRDLRAEINKYLSQPLQTPPVKLPRPVPKPRKPRTSK